MHQSTKSKPLSFKLSLVRILFQATIQTKKKTRQGALTFQILFQGKTMEEEPRNLLKNEWISKSPLGSNFHLIRSPISVEGILDPKIRRKSSPVTNSQSLRSRMNWTSQLLLSPAPNLVKEESIEACLSMAIPYSPGKASWRGWSAHYPSYQNLTLFPIPTTKWVFLLKSSQPIRIPLHKPHPWTSLPNLKVHPPILPQT